MRADLARREPEWLARWAKEGQYQRILAEREAALADGLFDGHVGRHHVEVGVVHHPQRPGDDDDDQEAGAGEDGGIAALAGTGPRVTVDEIMGPANRLALREGMAWGGRVAMAGLIGLLIYRRVRPKPDTTTEVRLKPDATSGADATSEGDRRG